MITKEESPNEKIVNVDFIEHTTIDGYTLRWAIITTQSGYTVAGKPSACVSPEDDNPEIGRKIAFDNAVYELLHFMGYHLSNEL